MALRVAATDLTAPLLFDLAAAYGDAHPEVALLPGVVPLSTLNADLVAGRADLGLVVTRDPRWFATPIGYLTFAIVVNPVNPVTRLSAAQVQAIYAGRINDWGQVGGAIGEIQVVGREEQSDAERAFSLSALSGAPSTLSALVAPTWEAMREAVSQNPNAIGYLPAPELNGSVKQVETRDLASLRAMIVAVAPGEPIGPARDFLAWAQSEAGQAVVAKRFERVK